MIIKIFVVTNNHDQFSNIIINIIDDDRLGGEWQLISLDKIRYLKSQNHDLIKE